MCDPPFVKLHYGPYEANGVIRHKTQRLHGVIQSLSKLGYEIEIVPSIYINRLSVEMLDREIFRCDIRNLYFNIECSNDTVCNKLIQIVEEAKDRLYSENNLPQYCPLFKGKRVIQEIKDAKNTQDLLPDVNLWFEIPKNSLTTIYEYVDTTTTQTSEEEDSNVL